MCIRDRLISFYKYKVLNTKNKSYQCVCMLLCECKVVDISAGASVVVVLSVCVCLERLMKMFKMIRLIAAKVTVVLLAIPS